MQIILLATRSRTEIVFAGYPTGGNRVALCPCDQNSSLEED
jgi:hypothetical protein